MVIEYRIEIEPTGVKITQTVDGNIATKKQGAATATHAAAGADALNLPGTFAEHATTPLPEPKPGAGLGEDPGPGGGGGPADGAVLILGPTFIFPGMRLAPAKKSEDSEETSHAKSTKT